MRTRPAIGLAFLFAACAPATPIAERPDPGCFPVHDFGGLQQTTVCADRLTTVQLLDDSVLAQGTLFLPANVERVRTVVVITEGGGLGHVAFASGFWRSMCQRFGCALMHVLFDDPVQRREPARQLARNAEIGSGDALLDMLDSLAIITGHEELATVKLLLWGFSAGGSFGPTFAAYRPERTLGFVRHHSHLREVQLDTTRITDIPALLLAGADDATAGYEDSRDFWQRGRTQGAPWALAVEPGEPHFSLDGWLRASDLTWHWMEALMARQDESAQPRDGFPAAWLADPSTGRLMPQAMHEGDASRLNWLPDSASAEAWKRIVLPPAE